ncbi:MAG: DSD1 family PLP-dependent enzyme [Pseudolabrys sp.]|nr:DSD1 family PLP-dependent enzyme [Pseudolabrys sp.]
MNVKAKLADPIVGLNVPATVGMPLDEVATPALLIDLDAFERNIERMRQFAERNKVRLRAHAKTHKSADIALIQIVRGGACGVCCQKVAEAEAVVAGGVKDVLVSNQVVDLRKIDRLARLAGRARTMVCVDDSANIDNLSAAAQRHNTTIECLVEIDVGAGRCGVQWGEPVVALAKKIQKSPGLKFGGLQAYQGSAQHVRDYIERKAKIDIAIDQVTKTVAMLKAAGLDCATIGGAGTGSYYFEGASGIYNELQCGSYVFMDADYGRNKDGNGEFVSDFENALFIWTSIMSHTKNDVAVCDAGLKAQSVDSGLPTIFGRDDIKYVKCSDEHGVISDPGNTLKLNDKLKLVPGHCDPTCNIYDWYVGVRNGKVECLWPVTARGMAF